MSRVPCTCVYATSKNTESVRKGYEMGGYIKQECAACKAGTSDMIEPGLDLDSDEPLVCNPNRPAGETCESCQ